MLSETFAAHVCAPIRTLQGAAVSSALLMANKRALWSTQRVCTQRATIYAIHKGNSWLPLCTAHHFHTPPNLSWLCDLRVCLQALFQNGVALSLFSTAHQLSHSDLLGGSCFIAYVYAFHHQMRMILQNERTCHALLGCTAACVSGSFLTSDPQ